MRARDDRCVGYVRVDAHHGQVQCGSGLSSRGARSKLHCTLCYQRTDCVQPVAWIPLDAIGRAYVDWVLCKQALPPLVNTVHPAPTTWDVILKGLSEELGDAVSVVPLQDWVKKLEERAMNPTAEDLGDIVRIFLYHWKQTAKSTSFPPFEACSQAARFLPWSSPRGAHRVWWCDGPGIRYL